MRNPPNSPNAQNPAKITIFDVPSGEPGLGGWGGYLPPPTPPIPTGGTHQGVQKPDLNDIIFHTFLVFSTIYCWLFLRLQSGGGAGKTLGAHYPLRVVGIVRAGIVTDDGRM